MLLVDVIIYSQCVQASMNFCGFVMVVILKTNNFDLLPPSLDFQRFLDADFCEVLLHYVECDNCFVCAGVEFCRL